MISSCKSSIKKATSIEKAENGSITTNESLPRLPFDVIESISKLVDDRTSAKLGVVSKEFNSATEERNKKTRLIDILYYCGLQQYLRITSNGYHIFSKNIHNPINFRASASIEIESLCVRALLSNIREIGDKLTELTITLPSIVSGRFSELSPAVISYFDELEALFKKKSIFKKLTILSSQFSCEFLHSQVEKKIFELLSKLTIDYIDIQFTVNNPKLLVNPYIRKIRSNQEFFLNYLPDLSGLNAVVFPRYTHRLFDIPGMSLGALNFLRIARSKDVKELTVTANLISEVLTTKYYVEKLIILNERIIPTDLGYLDALFSTSKKLTGLVFGKNLFPSVQSMSRMLKKFKPSLVSLSVTYQEFDTKECDDLLSTLLANNNRINQLEVISPEMRQTNHIFLEQATNLTSYSFSGMMSSKAYLQPLLQFVASHHNLKSLTLKFRGYEEESVFMLFYDELVAAIQSNMSIIRLDLVIALRVRNVRESAIFFSKLTKPLLGRGFLLNSVPVENIVTDVSQGLKDGLRWVVRDSHFVRESPESNILIAHILKLG